MATGLEKLAKMAGGSTGSARPIKEFPRPPKAVVEFGSKEFRAAMTQWWKDIDDWRRTLVLADGSTTIVTSTNTSPPPTTPAECVTCPKGDPGPPGATGPTGPTGPPGPAGADGASLGIIDGGDADDPHGAGGIIDSGGA